MRAYQGIEGPRGGRSPLTRRLLGPGPSATVARVLALASNALMLPGEVAMPAEQLRLAVPGLAGLAGFLLFPTLGSWVRLLLEVIEWNNRPGIGRPRRISGVGMLRAATFTLALAFFVLTMLRAAGDLRDIQLEAPVVGPLLQGVFVGIGFWSVYALALSALRADGRRRRTERRVGGRLR